MEDIILQMKRLDLQDPRPEMPEIKHQELSRKDMFVALCHLASENKRLKLYIEYLRQRIPSTSESIPEWVF